MAFKTFIFVMYVQKYLKTSLHESDKRIERFIFCCVCTKIIIFYGIYHLKNAIKDYILPKYYFIIATKDSKMYVFFLCVQKCLHFNVMSDVTSLQY